MSIHCTMYIYCNILLETYCNKLTETEVCVGHFSWRIKIAGELYDGINYHEIKISKGNSSSRPASITEVLF
jgi:hypothetical protein